MDVYSTSKHSVAQHIPPTVQTAMLIDPDQIETEMIGMQIMPPDQSLGGAQRAVELVAIDARESFGTREPAPHFDDQQRPPAAGDDIEFTTAADPIAGRDAPAAPLQMTAGP